MVSVTAMYTKSVQHTIGTTKSLQIILIPMTQSLNPSRANTLEPFVDFVTRRLDVDNDRLANCLTGDVMAFCFMVRRLCTDTLRFNRIVSDFILGSAVATRCLIALPLLLFDLSETVFLVR